MHRIEYPSPDPSQKYAGAVRVGIVGPSSVDKLNRVVAMRLALEYLITGPVLKAFQNHLTVVPSAIRKSVNPLSANRLSTSVDRERLPLATAITISEYELKQTLFSIEFHNVPTDMISNLPMFLHRSIENHLLRDAMSSEEAEDSSWRFYQYDDVDSGFDYNRMVNTLIWSNNK